MFLLVDLFNYSIISTIRFFKLFDFVRPFDLFQLFDFINFSIFSTYQFFQLFDFFNLSIISLNWLFPTIRYVPLVDWFNYSICSTKRIVFQLIAFYQQLSYLNYSLFLTIYFSLKMSDFIVIRSYSRLFKITLLE